MMRYLGAIAMAAQLLVAMAASAPASAQKPGGILKMYSPDSPASMSIHEEVTFVAEGPMMGMFNNLVMFDQHLSRTASPRSCSIWPLAGHGTRTGPT